MKNTSILFLLIIAGMSNAIAQSFTFSPTKGCPNTTHNVSITVTNNAQTLVNTDANNTYSVTMNIYNPSDLVNPIGSASFIPGLAEVWTMGTSKTFSINNVPFGAADIYKISGTIAYSTTTPFPLSGSIPISQVDYPVAKPPVVAGTPVIGCPGISVTLNATSNDVCTYSWSPSGTQGGNITINSNTTSPYTVTATRTDGGCTNTADLTVNVNSTNNLLIGLSDVANQTVCEGTQVTLNATVTLANTNISWNNSITNNAAFPANTVGPTTYTVTATNTASNCSITDQATVTVNANPATPAVSLNSGTNTLSITNHNTETISWFKDNVVINSATSMNYVATATGSYVAKFTTNGCTTASTATNVTITSITLADVQKYGIYPNPVQDLLNIESPEIIQVEVYSSVGNIIIRSESNAGHKISTESLTPGMYVLKMYKQNNQVVTATIVKK